VIASPAAAQHRTKESCCGSVAAPFDSRIASELKTVLKMAEI
jgi:hypothetical protein